jgi:uncharacterized protein (DUF362 family)
MTTSSVIMRSVKGAEMIKTAEELLEFCDWERVVPKDSRVFIKPNLCTDEPGKVESANTSCELLEAVCRVLLRRTRDITIGESDGARYKAESAFVNTGMDGIVRELGVKWMNFSGHEAISVGHPIFDRYETGLPRALLEADVLINMPVLKTHALTVFTGSVKNLWGCVPRYDRICLHKYLDGLLSDLVGILKPAIHIMDAIVGAEGRGPTNGIPRRMDLVLGSRDPVALDATAMRLVGLDPFAAKHIVLAHQKGFGQIAETGIKIDGEFVTHRVQFLPARLDSAVWAMNYLTRFKPFVRYVLFNELIFRNARRTVFFLRGLGLLKGSVKGCSTSIGG